MTSGSVGVRVDVDTHEGLRHGVPRLLEIFDRAGVVATFYFSMGPDNSGRAVFNLLKPGFLRKMLRTGAPSLYGLRTTLSGTLLPARAIGRAMPHILRDTEAAGHETGVHAWDHRAWQDRVLTFPPERIRSELDRGFGSFREATRHAPRTFAAPAWLTNETALLHQERFDLDYASDCRGRGPFYPLVGGRKLGTPQVPATLATLDEALGTTHATADAFFEDTADLASRQQSPVLTVHAEAEGGRYSEEFRRFLVDGKARGLAFCPLGQVLREGMDASTGLPSCPMTLDPVPGRHGRVSTQGSEGTA